MTVAAKRRPESAEHAWRPLVKPSKAPPSSTDEVRRFGGLPLDIDGGGEEDTVWQQIVVHLDLSERSLKAHHEFVLQLLEEHLDPKLVPLKPTTTGKLARRSINAAEAPRLSLTSVEMSSDVQEKDDRRHSSTATWANRSWTRMLDQQENGRGSTTHVPSPRGRPGAKVPSPHHTGPKLPLGGQPEGPQQDGGTEADARRSSMSEAWPKKLELHPMWANRRAKSSKKSSTSGTEEVYPLEHLSDDDVEPHTRRTTGWMRHFVLHPLRPVRMAWDVISLLFVLYDIIMIPMGFFDLPEEDPELQALGWMTRIFWSVDIPMAFTSGFVGGDGAVELRPRCILERYLRTWFFLDFLVVGVDWAEIVMRNMDSDSLGVARMGKASRPFRIIRLIRLLRLARMGEVIHLLMERLPSDILVVFGDILKLIVAMLGMGHLVACLWWAVGQASPAGISWIDQFQWSENTLGEKYIMSFRWALAQFAGGMDEVVPKSLIEHLYAAGVFVVCFWSGAVFLSILTSHMTQLYIIGSAQTQQLSMLRRYLAQHGVSRSLALRAQRNAQHVMNAQSRTMSEQAVGLLDLVSKALRIELHYEMYATALKSHPFFNDYMEVCPHVVRKICHAALMLSANSQGDVIFHFGETAAGMILVRSGSLRYSWGHAKEPHSHGLKENNYVSEAALWVRWAHRGSLTVVEDSIIILVNAESFQGIVSQFEQMNFDPAEYASWFVNKLNNAGAEVTDLPLLDMEVLPPRLARQSLAISQYKAQHKTSRTIPADVLATEEAQEEKDTPSNASKASVVKVHKDGYGNAWEEADWSTRSVTIQDLDEQEV